MSLTSYLTDPRHPELRMKFKEAFQRPAFNLKGNIKAEPLTKNYGIVGTAFDYLFRFRMQLHHQEKCIDKDTWVADHAFRMLMKRMSERKRNELQCRIERAKENQCEYLKKGRLKEELFRDALFLAKLDLYFRAGLIAPDLFSESSFDIQDLKSLCRSINVKNFSVKERCILNPTFGKGSQLVEGADADILLDDTLIEIKVTKLLQLERKHLNQIIGYYILSLIGGIDQHKKANIKKIGIYFARHGLLWTVPVSTFGSRSKLDSFKDWFIAYFGNVHSNSPVLNNTVSDKNRRRQ